MDTRKRGRVDFGLNTNGGFKKSKPEMDSLSSGIGSKSKPCTKFFSMAGCPFGENCHFLHYVPGGYKVVAQMMNLAPAPASTTAPKVAPGPLSNQNGSSMPAIKSKLCNKFNSPEGCKFNDKCHFAHGERELGKPITQSHEGAPAVVTAPPHFGVRSEPPPLPGHAGSFGASATAKISVDAALAGPIIGKGGANSKQICRQTGAKLSIRDHETDPNLKNIELEGSFEQIKQASAMVTELIGSLSSGNAPAIAPAAPVKTYGGGAAAAGPPTLGSNFKTKLCGNFAKGSCTFGDRCHFAHGASELRR